MAVPGYDDFESRCFWLQIELRQVMQYVDGNAAEFDNICFRQLPRPGAFVDVSAHGGDGRNSSQLFENLGIPDIPAVNDMLGPTQRCDRFGTKQAVRVGDDADKNGESSACPAIGGHQLVHLGVRRCTLHQRIRSDGLHFLRKPPQKPHRRPHRPRAQTDALHADRD